MRIGMVGLGRMGANMARRLAAHGMAFVDAGVCGGIRGLENGYALMVGGGLCKL